MADFPNTLPAPLLAGYSGEPVSAVIRTDFDSGPARQRQRFTATPEKLEVSWLFKPAEMIDFRVFFNNTIHKGADWFNLNLDIGDGSAPYVVRFVGAYKWARVDFMWKVSASIEVENA